MRFSNFLPIFYVASGTYAQTPGGSINSAEAAKSVGTGPYPAAFFEDPSLKGHTIYQPKTIPSGVKMPVVVWGNGGCIGIGTIMMPFLAQLASQGIVVIANGSPGNVTATFESFETAPRTTAKALTDAIDWAVANAGKGSYGHMDASRLAAAGQSCGGLEAMTVSSDPRVSAVGVFNSGSGLIGGKTNLTGVSKPFFFVLGGPTDMAYQYGTADYNNLPANVPAWKGNLPVGHGGTYNEVNGGKIGVVASAMYNWVLRGDATAAHWFTSATALEADGWDTVSKNLEKVQVTPI